MVARQEGRKDALPVRVRRASATDAVISWLGIFHSSGSSLEHVRFAGTGVVRISF